VIAGAFTGDRPSPETDSLSTRPRAATPLARADEGIELAGLQAAPPRINRLLRRYSFSTHHDDPRERVWGADMQYERGKDFATACSRLRHALQEKTGDGRLRDLWAWLDFDSKSAFLAALWSDDEASIAVRFPLTADIEFDPQMFIEAAESSERAEPHAARTERSSVVRSTRCSDPGPLA
jgi:hypothetical protein